MRSCGLGGSHHPAVGSASMMGPKACKKCHPAVQRIRSVDPLRLGAVELRVAFWNPWCRSQSAIGVSLERVRPRFGIRDPAGKRSSRTAQGGRCRLRSVSIVLAASPLGFRIRGLSIAASTWSQRHQNLSVEILRVRVADSDRDRDPGIRGGGVALFPLWQGVCDLRFPPVSPGPHPDLDFRVLFDFQGKG